MVSDIDFDMGDGVTAPPAAFPDGHYKLVSDAPHPTPYIPTTEEEPTMVLRESSVLGVPLPVFDPITDKAKAVIRKFTSGATRDQDTTKFDFEGFLSPLALARFAAYMHKNRIQSDGTTRASDNWQRGIPRSSYMKSLWRHLMTVWMHHRAVPAADCEGIEDALCGVIFNAQGYLHEIMKAKGEKLPPIF